MADKIRRFPPRPTVPPLPTELHDFLTKMQKLTPGHRAFITGIVELLAEQGDDHVIEVCTRLSAALQKGKSSAR